MRRASSTSTDEGFGTLDPDETLDTVTQALENLRTSERIVGIVTHLPQLAERLPAQIRVVKTRGDHRMTRREESGTRTNYDGRTFWHWGRQSLRQAKCQSE